MSRLKFTRLIQSQSGQAVTEYILVLVVVVAVILGGVYQLNSAFKVWANNYFGEYLACLLETGELPSLGGTPGDSGICNEMFQPFDFAMGRPYKNPGETTPSETRGGDEKGGGVKEANGNSRRSYVSSGSSNSSSFGRGGRSGGSNDRSQNIRKGKEKSTYTGSTESSLPVGAGYSNKYERDGLVRYNAVDGRRAVDVSEEQKDSGAKSATATKSDSAIQDKSRIKLFKRDIAKSAEQEDTPFTIGNFLRILLIAAIIIALFVLLAGQAMQIGKDSGE